MEVADCPPTTTLRTWVNADPTTVIVAPPAVAPTGGRTVVTAGGGTNVNRLASVRADVPCEVTIRTFTRPGGCCGTVATIFRDETTVTLAAPVPPNSTS